MITVSVAMQKGGQGKTTLARNLTFYAAEKKLRVLAVDLDAQRNFTSTIEGIRASNLGEDARKPKKSHLLSATDLFKDNKPEGMPLDCGGGVSLIAAERVLVDVARLPISALMKPRDRLKSLSQHYDLCVIDTAPTLGNPLYAALIASDFVVSPCTMDQDAMNGLADLLEDINRVIEIGWNPELASLGLLPNKVNSRRSQDMGALAQLRETHGHLLMDSVLYDRAATQYAKDRPVWREASGQSQKLASEEMKAACAEILTKIGLN